MKTRAERFAEKYLVDTDTQCWQWQAQTNRGYGKFRYPGGQLAHRFSYEHHVGPIPPEMTIDHLCRNRSCVNPEHLEVVTAAENTRRGKHVKTTCPNGHPYDAVRVTKRGWRSRVCTICERDYFRRRYQAQRAAGLR